MRRLSVVLTSTVLFASLLPPAAHADTTVVLRDLGNDESAAHFPAGFDCSVGQVGGGPYFRLVEADAPAPVLGDRSWGYWLSQHGGGDFFGRGVSVATAGELDTFGVQVYGAAPGSGRAMILAQPPGTAQDDLWIGIATVGGNGDAWTTVDAADLTYAWAEYASGDFTPTGATHADATLDGFVASEGASPSGYTALVGFGCDGQNFFFDGFTWGADGDVTTLDMEALSSAETIDRSAATITAGKASTITGTTTVALDGGAPVDLEVKTHGSSTWTTVATVTSGEDPWTLSQAVAPLRNASFRWHYLGSEVYVASYSPETTVKVRTAVTAAVADRTLRRGQNLVVTGRTKPAKPGVTVTLRRTTRSGSVVLTDATTKPDGSYRLAHPVTRAGTWRVFVTLPATPGNLSGRSVDRVVSVD